MEQYKRRCGDRKDGRLLRELDSLHFITGIIYPNRCDNEAYISVKVDLTAMNAYLARKNEEETDFPYTMFHIVVAALEKTITLRPKLNRFIVNSNFYQRNEVSAAFVVKKQFSDKGAEALAFLHGKETDTVAEVHDYIRQRFFPHMWCPGCGHGIVLNALLHAVDGMGLDKKDLVMVSGIGCSARISGYVDFHSLHTLHGRALAFATGLKLSKPELRVIVPMGDGDALAIGGNHFIHAARRNIDLTAIVMNNRIYGMTGGQFSPLSGPYILATTAPYRNIDSDFDVVELARAAGAARPDEHS